MDELHNEMSYRCHEARKELQENRQDIDEKRNRYELVIVYMLDKKRNE